MDCEAKETVPSKSSQQESPGCWTSRKVGFPIFSLCSCLPVLSAGCLNASEVQDCSDLLISEEP